MPQRVFDIVAENPQKQHIAKNMCNAAVHEYRRQQCDVHRARRSPQSGYRNALTGAWHIDLTSVGNFVVASDNFTRNGGKAVSKLLVLTHPLEKHEHQDVRDDDADIHDRQQLAVRVVVADWHDHGSWTSIAVGTGRFRTLKDNGPNPPMP